MASARPLLPFAPMAKRTRLKTGFTVALLPSGPELAAKQRRKMLVPKLRFEKGRKPPRRADGTPVERLRISATGPKARRVP